MMGLEDEMLNLIKRGNEQVNIVFFNVDYGAKAEDIQNLYRDIKFNNIDVPKAGLFSLDLSKDEAVKLVNAGAKVF